jgi:hypothetical protein
LSLDPIALPHTDDVSEHLLVTSLSVQGGEAVIGTEKTAFTRILMSGSRLENLTTSSKQAPVRQAAVLNLAIAEELTVSLHQIMNQWARSSPTPILPARGTWAWTAQQPPGDDILITEVKATVEEIRTGGRTTPIVRLDFTGMLLKALTTEIRPRRMPGAIFTVPRHVQSLISSLKKCTLALKPQSELQFLGFTIPSLDSSSSALQPSWPQQ